MNRVWKRFFRKLAEPLGFALYLFLTMVLAEYTETFYGKNGYLAVISVMFIIPLFAWLLKEIYRQAKREIDFENEQMIRRIKGE